MGSLFSSDASPVPDDGDLKCAVKNQILSETEATIVQAYRDGALAESVRRSDDTAVTMDARFAVDISRRLTTAASVADLHGNKGVAAEMGRAADRLHKEIDEQIPETEDDE